MRTADKKKCPWRIGLASWIEFTFGVLLSVLGCVGVYHGFTCAKCGPPDAPFVVFTLSFLLSPVAARLTQEGHRTWRNVTGAFIVLRVVYLHLPLFMDTVYLGRQGFLILDETFIEGFLVVEGITVASVLSAMVLFATQEARSYFGRDEDTGTYNE